MKIKAQNLHESQASNWKSETLTGNIENHLSGPCVKAALWAFPVGLHSDFTFDTLDQIYIFFLKNWDLLRKFFCETRVKYSNFELRNIIRALLFFNWTMHHIYREYRPLILGEKEYNNIFLVKNDKYMYG